MQNVLWQIKVKRKKYRALRKNKGGPGKMKRVLVLKKIFYFQGIVLYPYISNTPLSKINKFILRYTRLYNMTLGLIYKRVRG